MMRVNMLEMTVNEQIKLADGIYSMWLSAGSAAADAVPGQFLSVYSADGARLLPRPISICEVSREFCWIRIVYRVAGAGTREFAHMQAGEKLRVLGPLGNGYTLRKGRRSLLIAGGIGIPPLLQLAKELDADKTIILGYRNAQTFLADEFAAYGNLRIATEDASRGTAGTVMDVLRGGGLSADVIYSCGPLPMLRAVREYALDAGIECQISLEERMACGIGACLACVCESATTDPHSNVHNKRICKDGPVFDAREVRL